MNDLPQTSDRSSAVSLSTNLQSTRRRSIAERSSDADKFDTLLMLAAERTNYLDARRKNLYNENNHRKHRPLSISPQRKDVPLLLVEQQNSTFQDNPNIRAHQVRFSMNQGIRCSLN